MSDIAMSNETDLDWLVRATGGDLEPWCEYIAREDGKAWRCTRAMNAELNWFSKSEYLDRKAELQNKPSWKDAPEWAEWIFQNGDGLWFSTEDKPSEPDDYFLSRKNMGGRGAFLSKGEVLGDWRDTLERRPECTRAEMEVELAKAAFQPLTSVEDNQELNVSNKQEVKQDNGWFERGELPPVGTRVNVDGSDLAYGDGEKDCEVLTHVENTAVVRMSYGLGCFQAYVLSPSRTERELAIDEMCKTSGLDGLVFGLVAGKLYDAGYRKESK